MATENQKQIEKEKVEIVELKKTSAKLKILYRQEESSFIEAAIDLAEIAGRLGADDSSPESACETSDNHDAVVIETPAEEVNVETEIVEEYLDPLCAVRTPRKGEKIDCPVPNFEEIDPDSWSINVNQFFPLNCTLTPRVEASFEFRGENLSSGSFNLSPRQKISLGSIIEEEEVFEDNSVVVREETLSVERRENLLQIEYFACNMDDEDYKNKMASKKKEVRKVERMIENYTADNATLADVNMYQTYLSEIRAAFVHCQDSLDDVIDKLHEYVEKDKQRIAQIKKINNDLGQKFKTNDTEVKMKFVTMIADYEVNKPITPAEKSQLDIMAAKQKKEKDKEAKVAKENEEKAILKIKNAVKKFSDLKKKITDVKSIEEMSEQEIREKLIESQKWEKKIEEFTSVKEAIDQELVTVDVEETLIDQLSEEFDRILEIASEKIKSLTMKDKELGLFTLTPNKVKENIVYPMVFEGKPGENVYKFVKQFKEALDADQVRKSDQVKTLMKYLKGEAKVVIGDHHKSIDIALEALSEAFGNAWLILQRLRDNFDKTLGHFRYWGRHGTIERLNAINRTLDFIRQLESLAEDYSTELYNEVYHSSTIKLITKGMPTEFTMKMNETCDVKDSLEDWMLRISDILESKKKSNMSALKSGVGGARSKFEESDESSADKTRRSNSLTQTRHDCTKSKECKEAWDILGCINLYKIETVTARIDFMKERNSCSAVDCHPSGVFGLLSATFADGEEESLRLDVLQ